MKKKLLTLFMLMLLMAGIGAKAADQIYAVYHSGTLTLYYDDQCEARSGKTDWSNWCYSTTTVVLDESMKNARPESTSSWFNNFNKLTEIQHLDYLNTSEVTSMNYMFYNCSSLTSIDVSSFNTEKVEIMNNMFAICSSLTSLDLTSFNVDKVFNMSSMFASCSSLTRIYCYGDWSTKTSAELVSTDMFKGCENLAGYKGTVFFPLVTNSYYARLDEGTDRPGYFSAPEVYTEYDGDHTLTYYCDGNREKRAGTTELYDPAEERFTGYYNAVTVANIDPSMKKARMTSTRYMFYGGANTRLVNLQTVNGLENLNSEMITDMSLMFYQCGSLEAVDLSGVSTVSLLSVYRMFDGCVSLTSVNLDNFTAAEVTDMSYMFKDCQALETIDLNAINPQHVTDVSYMFNNCNSLTTIYCTSDWSTLSAYSNFMFAHCDNLAGNRGTTYDGNYVDAAYAHPDGLNDLPGYFSVATRTYTVFVDAPEPTLTYYYDAEYLFRTGTMEFYTPEAGHDQERFAGYANQVKKIVVDPSFKDVKLTSLANMFDGYKNTLSEAETIEGLENIDFTKVTDMYAMFAGCASLEQIDLSTFNTDKVTDMAFLFYNCAALNNPNLSGFNTENVTDMRRMFYGCSSITELGLNNFSTAKLEKVFSMFEGCSALETIWCQNDWSGIADGNDMFNGCVALTGSAGTVCDGVNNTGNAYAHPDGSTIEPGYFSVPPILYTAYDGKKTLTYYYDAMDIVRGKTQTIVYYLPWNYDVDYWDGYANKIEKVVIDPSLANKEMNSLAQMFNGGNNNLTALTTIEGLENIDFSKVTDMYAMFRGCSALQQIDLSAASNLNVEKLVNLTAMFAGCSSLKTILCESDWSTATAPAPDMFAGCTALEGGFYTKFNASVTDASYARPDRGTEQPGYFTGIGVLKDVLYPYIQDLNALYNFAVQYVDASELADLKKGIEGHEDVYNNPSAGLWDVRFSIIGASGLRKSAITELMGKGKDALIDSIGRMLLPDDNDKCKQIVSDAQAQITPLEWEETQSVTVNLAFLDPTIKNILKDADDALKAERNAVAEKKAELYAFIQDMKLLYDFAAQYVETTDLAALENSINAFEGTYNSTTASSEYINHAVGVASMMLYSYVADLMNKGKEAIKLFIGGKLLPEDNDQCKQIISAAQAQVDGLEWDDQQTVAANIEYLDATIKAIIEQVDKDLAAARTPTDVETLDQTVNRQSSSRKLLIDGQLYILRDGKKYNVQGTQLK